MRGVGAPWPGAPLGTATQMFFKIVSLKFILIYFDENVFASTFIIQILKAFVGAWIQDQKNYTIWSR